MSKHVLLLLHRGNIVSVFFKGKKASSRRGPRDKRRVIPPSEYQETTSQGPNYIHKPERKKLARVLDM
jgi:hypothetical protein